MLPTLAPCSAHPRLLGARADTGIDWMQVVHGEHGVDAAPAAARRRHGHRPDPRIIEVIDKGPGKGALIYSERKITTRRPANARHASRRRRFCRGDGGFGGPPRQAPAPHPIPERAPDMVCDLPTRPGDGADLPPDGDLNPLHAEPAFAKAAGFRARSCTASAPSALPGTRAQDLVRLRSGPPRGFRRPLLRAGVSGRDDPHRDVARRRRGELSRARPRARRDRHQQRPRGDRTE